MTKKHFEAIAAILLARKGWPDSLIAFDEGYELAREHAAKDLADYFATVNPRFDREQFLKAAGVS